MVNTYARSSTVIKVAGLVFGRFNPITTAFMPVVDRLAELDADRYIFISHDAEGQYMLPRWLRMAHVEAILKENYPDTAFRVENTADTLSQALSIIGSDYDSLVVLTDSTLCDELKQAIESNNGFIRDGEVEPDYEFSSIEVIPIDCTDLWNGRHTYESAYARDAVARDSRELFRKAIPSCDESLMDDMFDDLKRSRK